MPTYNLTISQRYDPETLQAELIAAGFTDIVINGHGEKKFSIETNDNDAANVHIAAHIQKSDLQHDAAILALENDRLTTESLTAKSIIKTLVLMLNDGRFVPNSNLTNQQLKQLFKDNL